MKISNVNILFNSKSIEAAWNRMDKGFINLFFPWLASIGVTEIYLTSAFRPEVKGSYHAWGMALDVWYIQWRDKTRTYFNRRNVEYSTTKDDAFYNLFKNKFNNNLKIEYISPSNVHTGYAYGANKYRGISREAALRELDYLIKNPNSYETNRNHLHHLHIALDPNPSHKTIQTVKENSASGIVIFLLLIGAFLKWRKLLPL